MFGLKNSLIRETTQRLSDPTKWNATGGYSPGQACIVTACFNAAVDRSVGHDCDHSTALRAIREVIEHRVGLSRGSIWDNTHKRPTADIISYNDHPLTTHGDVMEVLREAERRTCPFWRKPMVTA